MKTLNLVGAICACAFFLFSPVAHSTTISGLYNTGVDDSGLVLSLGSGDTHYSLAGPATNAGVISTDALWVTAPAGSAWIGPLSGSTTAPLGAYTYTLSFDLTGIDPEKVVLSGDWATDNTGEILLNGNSTGTMNIGTGTSPFDTLHAFTIGSGFVSGINTLEFMVTNLSSNDNSRNPSALLVANLSGTVIPIPQPSGYSAPDCWGSSGWPERTRLNIHLNQSSSK